MSADVLRALADAVAVSRDALVVARRAGEEAPNV